MRSRGSLQCPCKLRAEGPLPLAPLVAATAKQEVDWKKAAKKLSEAVAKKVPLTESMISDVLYTVCYGAAPAQVIVGAPETGGFFCFFLPRCFLHPGAALRAAACCILSYPFIRYVGAAPQSH